MLECPLINVNAAERIECGSILVAGHPPDAIAPGNPIQIGIAYVGIRREPFQDGSEDPSVVGQELMVEPEVGTHAARQPNQPEPDRNSSLHWRRGQEKHISRCHMPQLGRRSASLLRRPTLEET